MSLGDDIKEKVAGFMGSRYDITEATVIPDKASIQFGAHAKKLKQAIVLFADIRGSRKFLSDGTPLSAARAHKSFLYAASKCIRNERGELRSFSGDSVLAFFKGEDAAVRGVKAAMKIKGAVANVVNPIVEEKTGKQVNYGIGVAQGEILVVKSGVAGEEMYQDLLWVGWPTYHAVEYGNMAKSPNNIWISKTVFNAIKDVAAVRYSKGTDMWVYNDNHEFSFGKVRVYKTSYLWKV